MQAACTGWGCKLGVLPHTWQRAPLVGLSPIACWTWSSNQHPSSTPNGSISHTHGKLAWSCPACPERACRLPDSSTGAGKPSCSSKCLQPCATWWGKGAIQKVYAPCCSGEWQVMAAGAWCNCKNHESCNHAGYLLFPRAPRGLILPSAEHPHNCA